MAGRRLGGADRGRGGPDDHRGHRGSRAERLDQVRPRAGESGRAPGAAVLVHRPVPDRRVDAAAPRHRAEHVARHHLHRRHHAYALVPRADPGRRLAAAGPAEPVRRARADLRQRPGLRRTWEPGRLVRPGEPGPRVPERAGYARQGDHGDVGRDGFVGDYRYIRYETLDDGVIARITLDRPRTRNAQNRGLLTELGDAFLRAEADDTVRVVILCGAG